MASDIDAFLDGYSDDISKISQRLRHVIKASVSDVSETLHIGWKVISYGIDHKFCAIAPHTRWVNLQFHNGAALSDPAKRLAGTGKSMRHVKVAHPDAIDESLIALIKQAAKAASPV